MMQTATAVSSPNIAFIKYWGNIDSSLRIPENGSISMNLAELQTRTTVSFDANIAKDTLSINKKNVEGPGLERVVEILTLVRQMAGINLRASVWSENNFPVGAGIASSAAAFAALAMAATSAVGLELSERNLSRLARRGSGSACRSIPGGFVEWLPGADDQTSYARSIVPAEYWNLVDCVAIVSHEHKPTGSTEGHALAKTSPLQAARVSDAPRRLEVCRQAILNRDFDVLAEIIEHDSNLMHAVMMTSSPPLMYWQPGTMAVLQAVQAWRAAGLPVCYTIDAGPNVHVICQADVAGQVASQLKSLFQVNDVLVAHAGGPAALLEKSK